MKKLFLTGIMFVASLTAMSQTTMPKLAADGVDIVGSVYYSNAWDSDVYADEVAGLYRFSAGSSEPTAYRTACSAAGGATYHNGKIYQARFSDSGSIQGVTPIWEIIDYKTNTVVSSTPLKSGWENLSNSLTYDVTSDKIYGLARTNFNDFYLAKIDPATGAWESVGNLDRTYYWYSAIACNKYGELYAIAAAYATEGSDYFLVRINPKNAQIRKIGRISITNNFPDDIMIMMSTKSALFFNLAEDKLYWMFHHSSMHFYSEITQVLEMNINSGVGTRVAVLEKAYDLSGAFFTEPNLTAPAAVEGFTFDNGGGIASEGKFKFKVPTTTYDNEPLTSKVSVKIFENGAEILSFQGLNPGEEVESDVQKFTNGPHNFVCYTYNEASEEGLSAKTKFVAGYDLPGYPKNAKLTSTGQKVTITWDAPVDGLNGGIIDNENIRYRIVRYPGYDVIAENVAQTTYEDYVPTDMQRYQYIVVATYKSNDGYAVVTNACVAGAPLSLPYETSFADETQFYNYFNVLDVNKDGSTFYYDNTSDQNNVFYYYSEVNQANDWMFTPPVEYEAGATYQLSFMAMSSYSLSLEQVEVTFGMDDTPGAQSLIQDIEVPDMASIFTFDVTPTENGIGHFGLHIHTKAFSGYLRLYNLSISKTSGVNNIENDGLKVSSLNSNILVDNAAQNEVNIYDLTGALRHTSCDENVSVNLPSGIYIVKAGNQVIKIANR